MRSINDKPIFATSVVGAGVHNGNVNITLSAFLFSPADDGKTVEPDPVIVARLRMDIPCARQLMKNLEGILRSHDEATAAALEASKKLNGDAAASDMAVN